MDSESSNCPDCVQLEYFPWKRIRLSVSGINDNNNNNRNDIKQCNHRILRDSKLQALEALVKLLSHIFNLNILRSDNVEIAFAPKS